MIRSRMIIWACCVSGTLLLGANTVSGQGSESAPGSLHQQFTCLRDFRQASLLLAYILLPDAYPPSETGRAFRRSRSATICSKSSSGIQVIPKRMWAISLTLLLP